MAKALRGEIWLIDLGMVLKNRPGVILSVEYLDHERAVSLTFPERRACAERALKLPILRLISILEPLTLKELEVFPM
jgi:hypothetical protein